MEDYYVNNNAQANGDHEVHKKGCTYMPTNKTALGQFSSCHGAVAEAKRLGYKRANGCYYCCNACHTS